MRISYLTEALTSRRSQAGLQTGELCLEFLELRNEPPILGRPFQWFGEYLVNCNTDEMGVHQFAVG
jgi:hypothetical protein